MRLIYTGTVIYRRWNARFYQQWKKMTSKLKLFTKQSKFQAKNTVIPWILKFDEGKWRSFPVFQVDKSNFAEFVKEVLNILCPYVWWQVSDVYPTLIPVAAASTRHFVRFSTLELLPL